MLTSETVMVAHRSISSMNMQVAVGRMGTGSSVTYGHVAIPFNSGFGFDWARLDFTIVGILRFPLLKEFSRKVRDIESTVL